MEKQINFRNVDKDNFDEAIQMEVNPSQKGFMEGNLISIAECSFEKDFRAKVIYDDQTPVGFALYYLVEEEGDIPYVFLHRFMVDKKYQGKGYGKAALLACVDLFKEEFPQIKAVELMHYPDNRIGESLYEKTGFVPTGERRESEPCRCELGSKDPNRYVEIVRRKMI